MKIKPGIRTRWEYNVPLPIALLLGGTFFFAGYLVSLHFQKDIFLEKESRSSRLLEIGPEFAAEHGESGEDTIHNIPFQVLSWAPRILHFPGFANKHQCENMIALAKAHLKPSYLAVKPGAKPLVSQTVRTSTGVFLRNLKDETGTVGFIEEKMAKATMIPRENGESFNILRYEIGQKYIAHYDAFDPARYGIQRTNRVASMLLYLSDVEEGGETIFPYENYQNTNSFYNPSWCIGLKVKPRQGDALLFYSLHPNGTMDKTSLHASCPVIKGEKWVATKWMRDDAFDD